MKTLIVTCDQLFDPVTVPVSSLLKVLLLQSVHILDVLFCSLSLLTSLFTWDIERFALP